MNCEQVDHALCIFVDVEPPLHAATYTDESLVPTFANCRDDAQTSQSTATQGFLA